MTAESGQIPPSDDRIMAALAYFFGIIGALIVWAVAKDKSRFVRFHAIQALAFEGLMIIVGMLLNLCLVGLMFIAMFAGIAYALDQPSADTVPSVFWMSGIMWPLMFTCVMPFTLVRGALSLWAAISVAVGKDFRFPWLGKRVEAFLAT